MTEEGLFEFHLPTLEVRGAVQGECKLAWCAPVGPPIYLYRAHLQPHIPGTYTHFV